jgi:hypothetical protein
MSTKCDAQPQIRLTRENAKAIAEIQSSLPVEMSVNVVANLAIKIGLKRLKIGAERFAELLPEVGKGK